MKNAGSLWLDPVIPSPNVADLDVVFLRPLANGITLASLVYSGSVGVGKLLNMGG